MSGSKAFLSRYPNLLGDLRGAFASLLVGLPYSITCGILAFAPLGPAYLASGIASGIISTVVSGIVASLVGSTPCQINGPRGSVAVLMASMITAIATHAAIAAGPPPDAPRILGIAMLCIGLSGLFQVAFGILKFGAVVRFLPYPVISGFMVALGMLVVWPQIPAFLGITSGISWNDLLMNPDIRWGAVTVGLITITCFTVTRKKFQKLPAPLAGLLAGVLLHYLIITFWGPHAVGLTGLDTLINGAYPPPPWSLPKISMDRVAIEVVVSLLPIIIAVAFIGSIESLLSSSVLSIASQIRYNSNRELIAQGLSNIAVAATGGTVSCGAPFRGVANFSAGGRTPLSGALHSLMAIPLLLFALPLLLAIPIAALAGVLIVAGWDVVIAWRNRLITCPAEDIVVGILVMIVTLMMGTVPAIIFGIIGAMLLYVRNTSRAPLRGFYDGSIRQSSRLRQQEQAQLLRSLGSTIRVVDAQGTLFFGTADRFGREVEKVTENCKHLILNLQRVYEIDPTGALVLMQTMRRLKEKGIRTSIASVSVEGRRGRILIRAGMDKVVPIEHWFEDTDRALEDAENIALKQLGTDQPTDIELQISDMDICNGIPIEETALIEKYLERISMPAGSILFRENDPGDYLYLLAKGEVTVSVMLEGKEGRTRRLATYTPGVIFGEMAVIEGKRRSADALVVSDSVLYALSSKSLEKMKLENPETFSHFMHNLTRQLVVRLRTTTIELRSAYS